MSAQKSANISHRKEKQQDEAGGGDHQSARARQFASAATLLWRTGCFRTNPLWRLPLPRRPVALSSSTRRRTAENNHRAVWLAGGGVGKTRTLPLVVQTFAEAFMR